MLFNHGAKCENRTRYPLITSEMHRQQCLQGKMVVLLGLEPRLGTNQVRLVYKTNGAALHHRTKLV